MGSQGNADRSNNSESDLLLLNAKAGDNDALGELLERSRLRLLNQAQTLIPPFLKKKLGASDLVQQTFKEAARDFAQFREGKAEEFRAWLQRLLENNARDTVKFYTASQKRNVRKEREILDQLSRFGEHSAVLRSSESPSRQLENEDELAKLREAVARLNPKHRVVVDLICSGCTDAEIADRLNATKPRGASDTTKDAIRMLKKRILKKLRDEMKE